MNETTRTYYINKAEEFEKASNYKDALSSYMEAFSIKECLEGDNPDFFEPGFIEDKIAFLSYRLGDFRKAVTFGGKAYRANEKDERIKSNVSFYTDALFFLNKKPIFDGFIKKYIIDNFPSDTTILDVGAYDGRWSGALKEHFKKIDAVEAFEPYVERYSLKEKYNNVFVQDICDFKFKHYDLIIIGDVLEHLPIEKAQQLIKKIYSKCNQLLIIVPYEYPQDEYDGNKYQIHVQEDLTDEIFKERYPGFDLLAHDEIRGAYVKEGTCGEVTEITYTGENPRTLEAGLIYFESREYSKALGVFRNSLEEMSNEHKAIMKYYSGLCYTRNNENTLEALKYFIDAVELLPIFEEAYVELFALLEKFELWGDLEYYIRLALKHKEEMEMPDNMKNEWKSILFIQMTLALFKQEKYFEAYGYATLALDIPTSDERKKIAQNNFDQLKEALWSTLQLQ